MKTLMTPAALIAFAAMTWMSPAQAGHDTPLYRAACDFRQAAEDFEDVVDDSRYSSRLQRNLADDFEDAVSDLRNCARRPHRRSELIAAWQHTQLLQSQVESVIFGNPRCPSRVEFLPCWKRVLCAARQFEQELALLPPCGGEVFPEVRHRDRFGPPPGVQFRQPLNPIVPPTQTRPVTPAIPSWYRNVPTQRQDAGWGRSPFEAPGFQYRSRSQGNFRAPNIDPRLDPYRDLRGRSISPSQRQLNQSSRQIYRQPSQRQFDALTIGALISRLID